MPELRNTSQEERVTEGAKDRVRARERRQRVGVPVIGEEPEEKFGKVSEVGDTSEG